MEKETIKTNIWSNFKKQGECFITMYQHGSQFHKSLELAYDADMEVLQMYFNIV